MFFVRGGLIVLFISLMACSSPPEAPSDAAKQERSRSPFTTSPAQIALEEPCRYIGTFHKESRQRLEELRAQKFISLDEWKCMARALQALDKEMTVKCKEKKETLAVIEVWQTERYSSCLSSRDQNQDILECSLLSGMEVCLLLTPEDQVSVKSEEEETSE
ncbi:MAG: hypothetical protein VX252_12380 [Myxococcota bacterium]|nr:hypothetical protein [Myxococcota bacterium]